MNTKAIDVPQGSWDTTRSKQVHQSVNTLRVVFVKVPEHGVIRNIGLRVSLVASIHGRKLDRVPDEEDRKVIEDEILDTLLSIKLCCPTSNISNCIAGSLFTTDCGDASQNLGFLSNASEKVCIGQIRDVFEDFKLAKGTSSLCVHAPVKENEPCTCVVAMKLLLPLWNAFTCKMSEDFDSIGIAQEGQATVGLSIADLLHVAWIGWLA